MILLQLSVKFFQKTVLVWVVYIRVVELSHKLVQEMLGLEELLEDMQATHQIKMEQMASRVMQFGSCQEEQLSFTMGR